MVIKKYIASILLLIAFMFTIGGELISAFALKAYAEEKRPSTVQEDIEQGIEIDECFTMEELVNKL